MASGDKVAGSGPLGRDGNKGFGGSGSGAGIRRAQVGSGPGTSTAVIGLSRAGALCCGPSMRSLVPYQPSRAPISGRVSKSTFSAISLHPA